MITAITNALSIEQRSALVTRFTSRNPRWRGANADDILDALLEHDAHLDLTEPMHEFLSSGICSFTPGSISAATLALFYADGEPPWPFAVEQLCAAANCRQFLDL